MSSFEIIIHEHDGPVSNAALVLPSKIDLPPDDAISLLYMLDSELERIELEEEMLRQAEQRERAAELALFHEMMENEVMLDALGRRTLAIAGFEAAPIFYEPYFGYETKIQSTSYIVQEPEPVAFATVVDEPRALSIPSTQGQDFLPSFSRLPQRRPSVRAPAFYAHEPEPERVRELYDDAAIDWLARELIDARRSSVQSVRGGGGGGVKDAARQQQAAGVPEHTSGHVYVIDDGSVGSGLVEQSEQVVPVAAYEVEQAEDNEDGNETILIPESQRESTSTASPAETGSGSKTRAATVIDEEEEAKLETEGIPVNDQGPPRKAAKVQR